MLKVGKNDYVKKLFKRSTSMRYDRAGNLSADKPLGTNEYSYDAESRMIRAYNNGASGYYVYDGDGRRVRRIANSVEYWYVYGIDGELIAEYPANGVQSTPQVEYGYRNGQMLIVGGCDGLRWLVSDHLGTPRMEVDASGSLGNMRRHDYLPFGEELLVGMGNGSLRTTGMGYTQDCVRQRFDGYERDSETGLDFAQARYYASAQGRFTSADPLYIEPKKLPDPQQFNLYSYTRNNPLVFVDPTGMIINTSRVGKDDLKRWQQIADAANATDVDGNYLNPTLHNFYNKLQGDSRVFFIENKNFGEMSPTIGEFNITKFKGDNDFSEAVIQLDLKKIKNTSTTTNANLVDGFKKFEGLLGGGEKVGLRGAEVFGHEAAHAIEAINFPADNVRLQKLLNDRDALLAGPNYRDAKGRLMSPLPPDLSQKMNDADRGLIPTEQFAQRMEQVVNQELQHYSKRKK